VATLQISSNCSASPNPIVQAPMSGIAPAPLAVAVCNTGRWARSVVPRSP